MNKDNNFVSEENTKTATNVLNYTSSGTPTLLQFDRDLLRSHEMNEPVGILASKDNVDSHSTSYHGRSEIELQKRQRAKEIRIDPRGRGQYEGTITDQLRYNSMSWVVIIQFSLLLLAWAMVVYPSWAYSDATWTILLRLVRGPLMVATFIYFIGINMAGWISVGIDYVAMFDFSYSSMPTPHYIFSVAGVFSYLYVALISLYLFCRAVSINLPLHLLAGIMWASLLLFTVNPSNTFLRKGRVSFLVMLGRIALSPLYYVYFGDFWFADQICSTAAILLDLYYVACFSGSITVADPMSLKACMSNGSGVRPLLSCLPALWRFLQCLRSFYDTRNGRHLFNAAKYCTTFPVVFFATLFSTRVPHGTSVLSLGFLDVGWIVVCLVLFSFVNALYTFVWDIYFDWGMVDTSFSLRPHRLYRRKCYYYFAMVLNFLLRFAWTVKLTVWWKDSDLLYTALMVAEIFRRFVWNFFRVELEQVSHSVPDSK